MRNAVEDILLNSLKIALGPHDEKHEYHIYDTLDIYLSRHDYHESKAEKFIVENRMYRYYDRLVYKLCEVSRSRKADVFRRLLSYPDDFIEITTRYIVAPEYILPMKDPKYLKYIFKNIHAMSLWGFARTANIEREPEMIRHIIKKSREFPADEDKKLFHEVSINGDEVYEYLDLGATSYQLVYADLDNLSAGHLEEIAKGLTDIGQISVHFANVCEFIRRGKEKLYSSFRCMLLAGLTPLSCYDPDDVMGPYICPKLYDTLIGYLIRKKEVVNHLYHFGMAMKHNANVALHIYKKYIITDEGAMKEFICGMSGKYNNSNYFEMIDGEHLTCPTMVESIIELIESISWLRYEDISHLFDLRKASINNCIIKKFPDHLDEILVNNKKPYGYYDRSLAFKRILSRHGTYEMSMCPYENIDILDESHMKYFEGRTDIQKIIKRRRKPINTDSPYKDITFIFE